MKEYDHIQWHSHDFAVIQEKGEKRTLQVLLLTAVTMIIEIAAGTVFGSMALLADGWHMGTHVAAFAITIFAYRFARHHADNPAFSFGTGKVSVLGGFASAVALAVVALMMALESVGRLFDPQTIRFNEAIAVAVLGLIINLISAVLLQDGHDHGHDHGHNNHAGEHSHGHHDHNLRAAYFHVLADALTSVLAIVALFSGKYFGWNWTDPVMGIVGAVIITRWSYGLIKDTGGILLDYSMDAKTMGEIKTKIEENNACRIRDLHVWKVGPDHYAAIVSVAASVPQSPDYYKSLIRDVTGVDHVTIEVNQVNQVNQQNGLKP